MAATGQITWPSAGTTHAATGHIPMSLDNLPAFYARWWAAKLGTAGADSHSFLIEDDSWQAPYWTMSPKSRERDLYAHQVGGNG